MLEEAAEKEMANRAAAFEAWKAGQKKEEEEAQKWDEDQDKKRKQEEEEAADQEEEKKQKMQEGWETYSWGGQSTWTDNKEDWWPMDEDRWN